MAEQRSAQQDHAERALALAEANRDAGHRPDNEPTANDGMVSTPRENYPPSGAFDAEGREPALRRSRER